MKGDKLRRLVRFAELVTMPRKEGPPIRIVGKIPRGWDGFCPDCRRGADGFGDQIWCDCAPKKARRTKGAKPTFLDRSMINLNDYNRLPSHLKRGRSVELGGERFGRLLVLRRLDEVAAAARPRTHWECRCDCGRIALVASRNLLGGTTQSCGCLQRERASAAGRAAVTHGRSYSPEYRAWLAMKTRCYNRNQRSFKDYGGRGIKVAKEWRRSFKRFFAHVGPRPSPQHSLDRIDNNGHYAPGNVRWATPVEQRRNQREHKESS